MSVGDVLVAGGATVVLFLSGIFGGMLKREAESWIGTVPVLLLRAARRRAPHAVRDDLYEEWLAELHEAVNGTDERPLSRLGIGLRFSWGILRSASTVGRHLRDVRSGKQQRKVPPPVSDTFARAILLSYPHTRIRPVSYRDARDVGEYYRAGNRVVMDLTKLREDDARRLVDFAAGLAFGAGGTMSRIAPRLFLLGPRPQTEPEELTPV